MWRKFYKRNTIIIKKIPEKYDDIYLIDMTPEEHRKTWEEFYKKFPFLKRG